VSTSHSNKLLFTNSGSEAVDTALKIALAYHRARGDGARTRLIGRERGYHGVGFGGISVGGIVSNRKNFGTLLAGVDHMPHTHLPEKNAFSKKIKAMRSSFDSLKKSYTDIDTMLVRTNDKRNNDFFNMLEKSFDQQHARAKQQDATQNKLIKGKPSPKFKNYINYKGGKTSLDALKGKYVYIDVWATWCNPCIAEIPALKSLEKKYHAKNIRFVSISIDDQKSAGSWDKALAKWRKMVKDKNLTGTQLYAGDDIAFMKAYLVTGIPRFILIDPKGNIVNPNAPRPSDPALENLFKELGI